MELGNEALDTGLPAQFAPLRPHLEAVLALPTEQVEPWVARRTNIPVKPSAPAGTRTSIFLLLCPYP